MWFFNFDFFSFFFDFSRFWLDFGRPRAFQKSIRRFRKKHSGTRRPARPSPLTVALSRSKLPRSRPLINFRRPRRHFERAFSPDLAVLAPKLARQRVPGTPPASIFESKTTVFSKFFRSTAARCQQCSMCSKHRFFPK